MVGGGGSRVRGRGPALGAGGEARDHTHCLLGLRTPGLGSPAAGSRGPALPRPRAPEAPPPGRNPPAQSDHESSPRAPALVGPMSAWLSLVFPTRKGAITIKDLPLLFHCDFHFITLV